MKIGEIIRKYRKEKNLTQEEMANRLGVTAPAVNKWENGNSMPDITLIAPICRLLDITPDILLSFQEELTVEEISLFIRELNEKLNIEPFADVLSLAKKKSKQYPNCQQLLLQTALVLDAWRKTHDVPDAETYDAYICACYTRALESTEEGIRTLAANSLFGFYTTAGEYEKAEGLLSYFSKQNSERKRKQAFLYSKTGRVEEAWKAYEELLFSQYQMASMVLQSLNALAIQEKNLEKAHLLTEKQTQLAKVFEMGKYHELYCQLDLALEKKDADSTIKLVKEILESTSTLSHFRNTPLYEHMTFKELEPSFFAELQKNLMQIFQTDDAFDFLKEDARWKALIK